MPRILVVDDESDARYLLRTILTHSGYEVTTATNGAEALALAHAEEFDLVISDGLMPVMDGFRLCLELKRDPQLSSLPFIFHTASFTHPDDLQLASAMGADDYLLKPAEPSEIIKAVAAVLSRQEGTRETLMDARLVTILDRYGDRIEEKLDKKVADLDQARALRDSYHALLDHLPVHILTLAVDGTPDFTNNTATAFIGVTGPTALHDAIHPDDLRMVTNLEATLVADPRPMRTSMRVRHRSGEYHVFEFTARPYEGVDGVPLGFVLSGIDITRQEQQRELLLYSAEHDPLTDLPTRHVFDRKFDEILRNVGKGANCALLFIDCENLKRVNEVHGFEVGDAAVANLARKISECVRSGDLVARLCATEFVVLAEEMDWDEAGKLSDTIRTRVAGASLVPGAPDLRLGVSISINVIPEVRPTQAAISAGGATGTSRTAKGTGSRLLEALEGPPALTFVPVYSLLDGRLVRCALRYAYTVDERLIAGEELALGLVKHGVARRVSSRIVEYALESVRASGVDCSVPLSLASALDSTVFERAELAAEAMGVDPGHLMFELSLSAADGIRPPAGWIQAASRSPIRLIGDYADLSSLDRDGASILGTAEVQVPLAEVLNRSGEPHSTARDLIASWSAGGMSVTVTGVDDRAALHHLATLGAANASGDALSPIATKLDAIPRKVKLKG